MYRNTTSILIGYASTSVVAGGVVEVTCLSDAARNYIPGLSSRAAIVNTAKAKCSHCGQYGISRAPCRHCGAPVD